MVFRPDAADASSTAPTMPAVGTEGYFTDGSPPSVPPTTVDAWYLHALVEEIRNVVVTAGIAPAKGTLTQLLQGVRRIAAANRTPISASATLTVDQVGVVVVNAAAGNITLTLPAAAAAVGIAPAAAVGLPLEYIILRTDTSANTVTVVDAGSDTDAPGGATSEPVQAGGLLWIQGDGVSVWDIVFNSAGYALFSQIGGPARTAAFYSNGSWTCPAGVTQILVDASGGGGGGGYVSSGNGAGGGGAACIRLAAYTVVPGTVYTVTIGAAGTAQTSSVAATAGGATSLGALFSMAGGAAASGNTPGAAGGTGGFSGSIGVISSYIGVGGNSEFGAASGGYVSGTVGINAAGFGAGGTGNVNTSNASNGSSGFIVIHF